MKKLEELEIPVLVQPATSPNLNTSENIIDFLKNYV